MAKPWGAWFEADYIAKTRWFTTAAQHGIYRGLLGYYGQNGPLPGIVDELRAICTATAEEWAAHGARIMEAFFYLGKDGLYHNERGDKEFLSGQKRFNRLSRRGKAGADARWGKKGKGKAEGDDPKPVGAKPEIGDRDLLGDPTGPPDSDAACMLAVELYNTIASQLNLSQAQVFNKGRKGHMRARLRECGGISGWRVAMDKVRTIKGLTNGENDRGWRVDLDWLLRPERFTKLMEGGYDNWQGQRKRARNGGGLTDDEIMAGVSQGLGVRD